jgi:HPt (histidine-containing phosphotransfer) domain-containing protein
LNDDDLAIKSVLMSFIEATAINLSTLEDYISASDFDKIKDTAHKMAPMFKQIEATEIADVLTLLESKDYTKKEVKLVFEEVKPKIATLITALKKQLI